MQGQSFSNTQKTNNSLEVTTQGLSLLDTQNHKQDTSVVSCYLSKTGSKKYQTK